MSLVLRILVAILTLGVFAHAASEPKWIRISSDHFVVLTDADQKKGHEIAAHFEQMRSVFAGLLMRQKVRIGAPIQIIAIANQQTYVQVAPQPQGASVQPSGLFLGGDDGVCIVLNASDPQSYRAVEHQFAHFLLNFNYPQTPPWFDEGLAEYFASLYFTPQKVELGGDPELVWPQQQFMPTANDGLPLQQQAVERKPLTELLQSPVWLNLVDVLEMKNRTANGQEGTHSTLFYAQSWLLVHYLLNKNKLSEAGTYFGLVQIQRMPTAQAVQQAFGVSVAQMDAALKDYFRSLKPLSDSLEESKRQDHPAAPEPVNESAVPFSIDDVSTVMKPVLTPEALASVDEAELRIPQRRDQAMKDLQKLADDPKTETAVAHRALAFGYVQEGATGKAFEELSEAMQSNPSDPWTRLGLALAAYHSGEKGAKVQGLANMMESLHIVIDAYPEFAEAYNMLGWARLTGGGANAAVESLKVAVQLGPRREDYQMRLALALLAAKKFDDATATLDRLKQSQNREIAREAEKDLEDLPFLKKYGVRPIEENTAQAAPGGSPAKEATKDAKKQTPPLDDDGDDDSSSTEPVSPAPEIDKRPVKFAKATLMSVDCSDSPTAIVVVSQGKRTLKLRAADYKSLAVIGADQFSCAWKDIQVSINYRSGGKMDGDLVSIELHSAN